MATTSHHRHIMCAACSMLLAPSQSYPKRSELEIFVKLFETVHLIQASSIFQTAFQSNDLLLGPSLSELLEGWSVLKCLHCLPISLTIV